MSDSYDYKGSMSQDEASESSVFTKDQQNVVDDLIKRAVKDVRDDVHRDIAGLNRRNDELKKDLKNRDAELRKLRSEKVDDAESWKRERERQQAEIDAERKELNAARNRIKADAFAAENSLPIDLIKLVPMDDEAIMMDSLGKIKSAIDADRASVKEAQKIKGGDRPPAAGSGGKSPRKRKQDMSAGEAQIFVAEHGLDAYRALPN